MYVKGNSVHDVRIQEYLETDKFRRDNIGCSQSRPSKQERLKELRVKYPKQRALTKAEKMLLDEMGIEFWSKRGRIKCTQATKQLRQLH